MKQGGTKIIMIFINEKADVLDGLSSLIHSFVRSFVHSFILFYFLQVRRAQLQKLLSEENMQYEKELNAMGKAFYKKRL